MTFADFLEVRGHFLASWNFNTACAVLTLVIIIDLKWYKRLPVSFSIATYVFMLQDFNNINIKIKMIIFMEYDSLW